MQSDDDVAIKHRSIAVEFGPFDSSTDVQNWCMENAGCIDTLAHEPECACPACQDWTVTVLK